MSNYESDRQSRADGNVAVPRGNSLAAVAELVLRQLDCRAVVIRLDDRDGALAATGSELHTAALREDEPLKANGTAIDPVEASDPLTASELGLGFYAGLPLRLSSGKEIGVVAALGVEPRAVSEEELGMLRMMADIAAEIAELRLAAGSTAART